MTTKGRLTSIFSYCLYILIFMLPWQSIIIMREIFVDGTKIEYETLGLLLTEIILFITIFVGSLWYISEWRAVRPKTLFTRDRIFIFTLTLFSIYGYVQVMISADPHLTTARALQILGVSLLFLFGMMIPFSRQKMLIAWLAGAVAQSIFAIIQFFSQSVPASTILGLNPHRPQDVGSSIIASEGVGRILRAYGSFAHPNILGGYLLITLVIYLLNKEKLSIPTWLEHVITVLLTLGIFFSFSRSAWLGLIMFIFIILIKRTKKIKKCIIISIATITISVSIWSPLILTRLGVSASPHETTSTEERISLYRESSEIFHNSPLLGVGGGNYTTFVRDKNPQRDPWLYQPVHNTFLLFLTEYGLIGITLIILIIVSGWRLFSFLQLSRQDMIIMGMITLPLVLFDHYPLSSFSILTLLTVAIIYILKPNSESMTN